MKAFTDRANAMLPVDEPDQILLAMVQNYRGKACGPACPAGQSHAQDGRCLPSAIVARNTKKPNKASDDQAVSGAMFRPAGKVDVGDVDAGAERPAASADVSPPMAGRMALAGPKLEHQAGARRKPKAATQRKRRASRHSSNRRPFGPWIFRDSAF